jgi:hypothetical protein
VLLAYHLTELPYFIGYGSLSRDLSETSGSKISFGGERDEILVIRCERQLARGQAKTRHRGDECRDDQFVEHLRSIACAEE